MFLNKSIVIAALARDCANSIIKNKIIIEELRGFFKESHVVIIENDSKDNTKQVLKDYACKFSNVHILSKDFNNKFPFNYCGKAKYSGMSTQRIARMIYVRNILLNYIKENFSSDYILFIDIDIQWFSPYGIINAIKNAPDNWGALFANGHYNITCGKITKAWPLQYDVYAYLEKGRTMQSVTISENSPLKRIFIAKKINDDINSNKYLEVTSAFGGIGIYKAEAISQISYEINAPGEWNKSNMCLCEHIGFNSKISAQGYKLFISQDLECIYGTFEKNKIMMVIMYKFPRLYSFLSLAKTFIKNIF